jgi:hypothetical protein
MRTRVARKPLTHTPREEAEAGMRADAGIERLRAEIEFLKQEP